MFDFFPERLKREGRAVARRVAGKALLFGHFGKVNLLRTFCMSSALAVARLATNLRQAWGLFIIEAFRGVQPDHVAGDAIRIGLMALLNQALICRCVFRFVKLMGDFRVAAYAVFGASKVFTGLFWDAVDQPFLGHPGQITVINFISQRVFLDRRFQEFDPRGNKVVLPKFRDYYSPQVRSGRDICASDGWNPFGCEYLQLVGAFDSGKGAFRAVDEQNIARVLALEAKKLLIRRRDS